MHGGMPYDLIQGHGQGHEYLKLESHSTAVDSQFCTGLIFILFVFWLYDQRDEI